MPTSNSTNFAMNTQQTCEAALRLARVLGIGQSVDAQVMTIARQNLNIMIRHWENAGVRIWGIERAILFPLYGQQRYDIPLVTGGVPLARYRDWKQTFAKILCQWRHPLAIRPSR